MEDSLYSSLGRKTQRSLFSKAPEKLNSLKEILDQPATLITKDEVLKSLVKELKRLLLYEDIDSLIEGIFLTEHFLEEIAHYVQDKNFPLFEDFYKNLSPIVLRTIQESMKEGKIKSSSVLEALRVAVEEELYYWQEELFQ
jgi:hypothetical protein